MVFSQQISQQLTSKKIEFVKCLTEFLTKIEYVNSNYFINKGVKNIKILYLKKDGLISLIIINDVLYILETKTNLGQLNEQKIDIRIIGIKIYLH